MNRLVRILRSCIYLALLAGGGSAWWYHQSHQAPVTPSGSTGAGHRLVELVDGAEATLRFTSDEALSLLGIDVCDVAETPAPREVRLLGTLLIDPNRLIHVHSRFPGEVVSIGEFVEDGQPRPLRYGDRVSRGDLLASLWSKEIGDKKSELVDALSRLAIDRSVLDKLESVTTGVVSQRQIMETRRKVDADLVDVSRIERTLRSWRLTEQEIDAIKGEAAHHERGVKEEPNVGSQWAETQLRSPIDGVVVEKNFNVGDIVDAQDNLFKVADLGRLQVLVNVYEDDMKAIRALPPQDRRWMLEFQSAADGRPVAGTFDLFGTVIDPAQRTGTLIGWLDNPTQSMLVGQFVTATIRLPVEPGLIAVPEASLIEEGDAAALFLEVAPLTFSRVPVQVARRLGGTVLVTFGDETERRRPLAPSGMRVVVRGVIGMAGELVTLQAQNRVSEAAAEPSRSL